MRGIFTQQAGLIPGCLVLCTAFCLAQESINLLKPIPFPDQHSRSHVLQEMGVTDAAFLELSVTWEELTKAEGKTMVVNLPALNGELLAAKVELQHIYASSFRMVGSDGRDYTQYATGMRHYFGHLEGSGGLVAFSMRKDEFTGIYVYEGNHYNIELWPGNDRRQKKKYILYQLQDLREIPPFECATSDEEIGDLPLILDPETKKLTKRNSGSVDIYLECDYQTYLHKGSSVADVSSYITGLFNVVAGVFDNAGGTNLGPQLLLSELKIWTSPDPYDVNNASSSLDVLTSFECQAASYNGRIAHLVSTSNNGLGGIASRPTCSNPGGAVHGFSNIAQSYSSDLNIYSWSVNILAHELGHNMSSPHTHACAWDGQQIDDCGNVYLDDNGGNPGSCYDSSNPIIPAEGTIMSYCHLSSGNGIDLSLGFHPKVADQINAFADCISEDVACPTASVDQIHAFPETTTSVTLQCDLIDGISYYYWEYREVGADQYESLGVTSQNFTTLDGLDATTQYEFMVVLYCNGWGAFSCSKVFSLSPGDCPDEINLNQNPIPSGTYMANQSILASGQVMTNSSVNFTAGNAVNLQPGFSIGVNGILTITIDPSGCQ